MKSVMMVAAEASSGLLALRLIQHLKGEAQFFGVGNAEMEAEGFERIGRAEEMAVVGLAEIIEHYGDLKRVFNRLLEEAQRRRPSVVVLLDYPEFNLMLAKKLHVLGIPVLYYVSPQIWAWRKNRVFKIKKYCQKMLVLFPFEAQFYEEHGVPVRFVGHPVLDDLNPKYWSQEYRLSHRSRFGLVDDQVVVGLMPGSRRSELKNHMATQLEVARRLVRKYPGRVRIAILCAPTFEKSQIEPYLEGVSFPYMFLKDDPLEMIHLTDIVLAASGTATLMVGLLHKPMVIMYRFKWFTGLIAKLIVKGVRFFGLINLIMDREICPERWQEGANPDELTRLMSRYLDEPEYYQQVIQDLRQLQHRLGDSGATARVAEELNYYLNTSNLKSSDGKMIAGKSAENAIE